VRHQHPPHRIPKSYHQSGHNGGVLTQPPGEWTFEQLSAFLADPSGMVPGTEMFQGFVLDRDERIALIAYLRTQSDDPVTLP